MNPLRSFVADAFDIFATARGRYASVVYQHQPGFWVECFTCFVQFCPYFLVACFCLAYRWLILQRLRVRMMMSSCVLSPLFQALLVHLPVRLSVAVFLHHTEIRLNIRRHLPAWTKPCCISSWVVGCYQQYIRTSPIANTMNGKKAAPCPAKIRITVMYGLLALCVPVNNGLSVVAFWMSGIMPHCHRHLFQSSRSSAMIRFAKIHCRTQVTRSSSHRNHKRALIVNRSVCRFFATAWTFRLIYRRQLLLYVALGF